MPDTILRKCGGCSETIEISRSDVSGVIFYKKKYYHLKCFCGIAEKRSRAKRSSAAEWKDALDGIVELESDTKKILESAWAKDDLNEWLLDHYNITSVPSRLWQMLADLERGIYKGKKSKSVSMETMFNVWKWGQRKLDEIAIKNKNNHLGPQNDMDRLMYDLAILVNKLPLYLKKKETSADNEIRIKETKEKAAKTSLFNYEELSRQAVSSVQTESNDILDLMNEIF